MIDLVFSVGQIGKRSCQDYRIRRGYSLLFCSGCRCFSGAVHGVEVITQGARSANDFEINPNEGAQGRIAMSIYICFSMLYKQTSRKYPAQVHSRLVCIEM
jgi:hypothetical protein